MKEAGISIRKTKKGRRPTKGRQKAADKAQGSRTYAHAGVKK